MGKDILLKAFKNEKTNRTPWVPFVGCHGGKFIGRLSDQYLKSAEHMTLGLAEAINRYKPGGIGAIILAEYKLKTEGIIPELVIIKEWLKEILNEENHGSS